MRVALKSLLMLALGSLLLLGQGNALPVSAQMQRVAAERALVQVLGGPVALCVPGDDSTPDQPAHDQGCGLCCLATGGRGLASLPPIFALLPPVRGTLLPWSVRMPHAAPLTSRSQPQQPRAPPEWV